MPAKAGTQGGRSEIGPDLGLFQRRLYVGPVTNPRQLNRLKKSSTIVASRPRASRLEIAPRRRSARCCRWPSSQAIYRAVDRHVITSSSIAFFASITSMAIGVSARRRLMDPSSQLAPGNVQLVAQPHAIFRQRHREQPKNGRTSFQPTMPPERSDEFPYHHSRVGAAGGRLKDHKTETARENHGLKKFSVPRTANLSCASHPRRLFACSLEPQLKRDC
jgi:hypothetical protein